MQHYEVKINGRLLVEAKSSEDAQRQASRWLTEVNGGLQMQLVERTNHVVEVELEVESVGLEMPEKE